jgi:uncharacterized protein (TIGR02246 family)
MTTATSLDPQAVAESFYAAIEAAWNAADGEAFGAQFADVTDFVNIRGEIFHGDARVVAAGHQAIFDTIYRGSTIRYQVDRVRVLTPNHILVHATAKLDAPAAPPMSADRSQMTVVLVDQDGEWKATAFHNTLVMST